jgi:TonB family protein
MLRRLSSLALSMIVAASALAAGPAFAQGGAPAKPVVTPPQVVQHVDAVYPARALAERKHADVMLAVTIDADGHVSKVEVLASGGADLDEAAISAARQWVFEPAKRDGAPAAQNGTAA